MTDTDASQQPSRFAGMTVNERLFVAGLFKAWQAAVRARNRTKMLDLLSQVSDAELTRDVAIKCVDTMLADPAKYGY